ncbi:MAG TPA: hypothetical protein PKM73_19815 [Verrucomicrobiota bacterium]|nr:hypothetical protein [Verrucomicrobiota bacterium]HNU53180.1 hypothetical protein [Verrucomicrobiota bacterium]
MPRSRYLAVLAKADVDSGGKLIIDPEPVPGEADSSIEIAKFLEIAVPALADYELRRNNPQAEGSPPEPPEALAENQFWRDFLDERDEILRLRWTESEKAGRDMGCERAVRLRLKHRSGWR